MAHPKRTPLQVSDTFLIKLKELQRKVRMNTGDEKSLRELTEHIASSNLFSDIEKQILHSTDKINMDIKIRLDKRVFGGSR